VRCRNWHAGYGGRLKVLTMKDNLVTAADPGFVDAKGMNFQLKPDGIVFQEIPTFQRIPFAKIGLYKDHYRLAIPPRKL
jgi:hypothetical protein